MSDSTELERYLLARLTRRQAITLGAELIAGSTLLGALLVACGNQSSPSTSVATTPKRGGTLRIAISSAGPGDTVDPARATSVGDIVFTFNVFDRLVYQNPDWSLTPMLAEKWEANADATQWTFHLRQGVQFHDGSPFGAADVAWTLTRILDPKTGSSLNGRVTQSLAPSGIEIIDDHTLVLHLKQSDSVLPIALGDRAAGVVKRNAVPTSQTVTGTGPFSVTSWTPGQSFELKRNPSYWQKDAPLLDGVRMVYIPEQATKLQSMQSGSVDMTDAVDFSAVPSLKADNNVQLLVHEASAYFDLAMDTTHAPFNDPRVIKAIKLAIDRTKLNQAVFQGLGVITGDTPEPPNSPYYPPGLKVTRDVKQAQSLLAQAGFASGVDIEWITTDRNAGQKDFAVACADMLKDAGIRVKLTTWPGATFNSQVWLKQPMYNQYFFRRFPTDAMSLLYGSTGVWNESKIKSSALDALIQKALATADHAAQTKTIQQALQLINDDFSNVVPVYLPRIFAASKKVNRVVTSLTGTFNLRTTWLS